MATIARTPRQAAILAERDALLKTIAEYRAEVEYHASNGHRASHCIHGTYMWSEYDNICGGCESDDALSVYSTGAELLAMARDSVDWKAAERERWIAREVKQGIRWFGFVDAISDPTPIASAFALIQNRPFPNAALHAERNRTPYSDGVPF